MTCEISITEVHTDTSEWSACSGTSASGIYGAMSAEVKAEVCAGASGEDSKEHSSVNTIVTKEDDPVVACQEGKFLKLTTGEVYVEMIPGFQLYKGKDCTLPECPPILGAGGASIDEMSTGHGCRMISRPLVLTMTIAYFTH